MEIETPKKERNVSDYDFMFSSGSKLTVTLDFEAGDKLEEQTDRYVLDITPKPTATDPDEFTDEEQLLVFKAGLAAINICKRVQRLPSEEEIFEMYSKLHGATAAKKVQ